MTDDMATVIGAWTLATAQGVLGRPVTRADFVAKLREEAEEFVGADMAGAPLIERQNEAADVVIVLLGYARLCGFQLGDAVRGKHALNLMRRWVRAEDGTMRHAEEAGA